MKISKREYIGSIAFLAIIIVFNIIILLSSGFASIDFFLATGFLSIFYALAIYMVSVKRKAYIKDRETELKGEICYARVKDITQEIFQDKPSNYVLSAFVYVGSTKEIKVVHEVNSLDNVGLNSGNYMKVKYYTDDLNIIEPVKKEDVPEDILAILDDLDYYKPNYIEDRTKLE